MNRSRRRSSLPALPAVVALVSLCSPQRCPAAPADEVVVRRALAVPMVLRAGRSATRTDAVEHQIVTGTWSVPHEGDELTMPDGSTRTWKTVEANADGWFEDDALWGGYAHAAITPPEPGVWILEAQGHSAVYVNGELRVGDPYHNGYVQLPVALHAGANDLLFLVGRGFRASLTRAVSPALLNLADPTMPDLIVGRAADTWGAVVVLNATGETARDLSLVSLAEGGQAVRTPLPPLLPLATRKVGFRIAAPARREGGTLRLRLALMSGSGAGQRTLDVGRLDLRVRRPAESRKVTFLSAVDGSVQYYGVMPPSGQPGCRGPALFLTLHGAGVEAIGQADAYSPKSWGYLVAPTNRRPYGFDWEDWGRWDAIEVLEEAQRTLHTDPSRVYLTGHSMGGHGVWHLGACFPDRFAAIGPSAGWASLMSYGGGGPREGGSPVEKLIRRTSSPSDTPALAPNYAHHGVYVLHGADDDNVPVREARSWVERLTRFHRDFVYHEQPGAGHWWDVSDEPGADCVDWAPMFDFFARHAVPCTAAVRRVQFATFSPSVSADCHWVTVETQLRAFELSTVDIGVDPASRRFVGTTGNVHRLGIRLDALPAAGPVSVELDGCPLTGIDAGGPGSELRFERVGNGWRVCARPPSSVEKSPRRGGPFKEAFRNRVAFVYGTGGTANENRWSMAKARYDAEAFWYRANGSVDIVADTEARELGPDRSIILYGNADTNRAWEVLLRDSPVQVRRGSLRVGNRRLEGDDLACLFVRPGASSDTHVGVVAGTGMSGLRLTERMPYFVSGVALPDWTVCRTTLLSRGTEGLVGAGFFGNDWSVEAGESAWAEGA